MTDEAGSSVMHHGLDSLIRDPKPLDDLSEEANRILLEANSLADAGDLDGALEMLFVLEKRARIVYDGATTSRVLIGVAELLHSRNQFDTLLETVLVLCKKRGQLKRSIVDLVKKCTEWIDTFSKDKQYRFIASLCAVTEGKIFVEVERANLRMREAKMKEAEGDIDGAAKILQEEQVETIGSMDKMEKAYYILEQLRVVLKNQDYTRTQIISRKLNPRQLESPEFHDAKVQYYGYMVRYWLHEKNYLEVFKCYSAILNSEKSANDEAEWKKVLTHCVIYILLADYSNEKYDLLDKFVRTHRRRISQLPEFKCLLDGFKAAALLKWPLQNESVFRHHNVFSNGLSVEEEGGEERWALLRKRVVQHNLNKVAAKYYSKISLKRLAEILGLSIESCEAEICELVSTKFLCARIDRPAGEVRFGKKKTSVEHLDSWNDDVREVMSLLESTCHLIAKEEMIASAREKMKAL